MSMQHPTKKIMKIKLTIVLLLIMAVIDTKKSSTCTALAKKQDKLLQHQKILPYIFLLNEHGVRNNGQIKIYGYKTEWKNVSNQARDRAVIAIKRNICHRIINNLSNNTVACKIQTEIGLIIIAIMYIPPNRPIISRSDFDILKTHNCPVYVLGDFNGNHRQLGIDKLMIQENN